MKTLTIKILEEKVYGEGLYTIKKYTISTECPTCQKDFIRDVYEEEILACCALDICETCENLPITIIRNENYIP